MTQEDKDLLFRNLCARLPYGVKCIFHSNKGNIPATVTKIDMENEMVSYNPDGSTITYCNFIEYIKPYLRPMSSMTDEEKKEFEEVKQSYHFDEDGYILQDWLNEHHFDYRGLIEKGLALEAPKGMYK